MADKDVTDQVNFGYNDDECLPIGKCVCGSLTSFFISIDRDDAYKCPSCGRELYFKLQLQVFEKSIVEGI